MMAEDIENIVKCLVCDETPVNKIYQCKQGHIICSDCLMGTKACSSCKKTFDDIDNPTRILALERLLDLVDFDCPLAKLGCKGRMRRKKMKNHLQNTCEFNRESVKLCQSIGFTECNHETNPLAVDDSFNHFQKKHGCALKNGYKVELTYVDFLSKMESDQPVHGVDLLDCAKKSSDSAIPTMENDENLNEADGHPKFVILCKILAEEKSVSWNCIWLCKNSESETTSWQVKFLIKNTASPKEENLVWIVPALKLQKAKNSLESAHVRIPFSSLQKNFLSGRDLNISVMITRSHFDSMENCFPCYTLMESDSAFISTASSVRSSSMMSTGSSSSTAGSNGYNSEMVESITEKQCSQNRELPIDAVEEGIGERKTEDVVSDENAHSLANNGVGDSLNLMRPVNRRKKYDRDILLQIGKQSEGIKKFKVAERGLPELDRKEKRKKKNRGRRRNSPMAISSSSDSGKMICNNLSEEKGSKEQPFSEATNGSSTMFNQPVSHAFSLDGLIEGYTIPYIAYVPVDFGTPFTHVQPYVLQYTNNYSLPSENNPQQTTAPNPEDIFSGLSVMWLQYQHSDLTYHLPDVPFQTQQIPKQKGPKRNRRTLPIIDPKTGKNILMANSKTPK